MVSGRQLRRYASFAELMERDLIERGVAQLVIIGYPQRTDNTLEEALGLRRLAVERGWHRIVVVTSNSHTRRARYIFRGVFPASIEVRVSSARDSEFDIERWWETRRGKRFFLQSAAFAVAMWELLRPELAQKQPQPLLASLGT